MAAVYDVPQSLPTLGSATPTGLPFDAGSTISATLLNQVLRGLMACGVLQAELTELNISDTIAPINAGLIAAFLPAFEQLDPTQPIHVMLRPALVPVVSGRPGPMGELLDLRVAAYFLELMRPDDPAPLLQLALDLRAGIDLQLAATTGAVQPRIGEIADLSTTLLINPLGVDVSRIDFFIDLLLTQIDGLNDDLEPMSIPGVNRLSFDVIDVQAIDAYLGVFVDFMIQP